LITKDTTSSNGTHNALAAITLAITLLCVWSLTYEYRGLVYDAQIYAVQALAKLRPSLAGDLFLQNVSQDRFTVFPRFYAWVIYLVGLRPAALILTVVFTIWMLAASWDLMATLTNSDWAWLGIFMMVILEGYYGAFGVFYISEPFLTARLPAEALLASSLACYFRGYRRVGFGMAAAAFLVHPLMAVPGFLILFCGRLPLRTIIVAASLVIAGALATAIAANTLPSAARILVVMDAPWINIVRERSQFLFVQLWRVKDWALNARVLLTLALATMVFPAGRAHKLALAALVVGATGIAIGAIASLIGPVALLMQGQAWRWQWLSTLLSILLLARIVYGAWHGDRCGPVCAALLIGGWLLPVQAGAACVSFALIVWTVRSKIPASFTRNAQPAAGLIALALASWSLMISWTTLSGMAPVPSGESFVVACIRSVFASKLWCVLFAGAVWWAIKSSKGSRVPMAICVALGTSASMLIFQSSNHVRPYGSPSDIREFSEWRERIPAGSTVFVTNGYDSGSFVWFTLQRNNYLSPSQSAGVVFSRATALEVHRRSEVLLPLTDPNWKILTSFQTRTSADPRSAASAPLSASLISRAPGASYTAGIPGFRPLTAQALVVVCQDPQLGFVVSPDDAGFDPLTHANPGIWKNWKLYDCSHVRVQVPKA
jgi:hypothetical protein